MGSVCRGEGGSIYRGERGSICVVFPTVLTANKIASTLNNFFMILFLNV
jgi:hypothetical protein